MTLATAPPSWSAPSAATNVHALAAPDPALIVIAIGVATIVLTLTIYREWLARDGVEPVIGKFPLPEDWMWELGPASRSRASATAVPKISSILVFDPALIGVAITLRQPVWSTLPGAAFVVIGIAIALAVAHVAWLWRDPREDAFDGIYWRRKEVPLLYDEDALRALFLSKNPMPLWSVFDRNWQSKVDIPDAFEMEAATIAARAATLVTGPRRGAAFSTRVDKKRTLS